MNLNNQRSGLRCFNVMLAAFVLASFTRSEASTFYVSTTGNNSAPGTQSQPWRTVVHAVNSMQAGDTTYVRGGLYQERTIRFKQSGRVDAPIKLLSYQDERPIIQFINGLAPDYHHLRIEHASGPNHAMGWITVQGFEIRGGNDGIKFHSMHDSAIRQNWIHDNNNQGILGIGGHHNVFDRNIISRNGSHDVCDRFNNHKSCMLEHGLYASGKSYTITNNLFYDNLSFGIQINGGSSGFKPTSYPSREFADSHDWLIANNTFAYGYSGAGIVLWAGGCKDIRVFNNIFYENGVRVPSASANGVLIENSGPRPGMLQVRNNLSFVSGSGATLFLRDTTGKSVAGVHYVLSDNILQSNPHFVNGGNNSLPILPDFRLLSGSPAMNQGLNLFSAGVTTDFLGRSRPKTGAFDIGAYELGPSRRALIPGRPTSVRVR